MNRRDSERHALSVRSSATFAIFFRGMQTDYHSMQRCATVSRSAGRYDMKTGGSPGGSSCSLLLLRLAAAGRQHVVERIVTDTRSATQSTSSYAVLLRASEYTAHSTVILRCPATCLRIHGPQHRHPTLSCYLLQNTRPTAPSSYAVLLRASEYTAHR